MCCKFRGERHHALSCGIRWGKGRGDQEVFPEEVFKDGQGFDRWRELQPHKQRDGMDNRGVTME